MTWAQRLERVFGIDVNTCVHCGGAVRIVASIEEPTAIRAILSDFEQHGALGPLSGIGEKWLWTAPLRGSAIPKFQSQASDPRPNRRMRGSRLPDRLAEQDV